MVNDESPLLARVLGVFDFRHKASFWRGYRDGQAAALVPLKLFVGLWFGCLKRQNIRSNGTGRLLRQSVVLRRKQPAIECFADFGNPREVKIMPRPRTHTRPVVNRHTYLHFLEIQRFTLSPN